MNIKKNTPVRFQGDKYRVVRVISSWDIVIRDIDGKTLIVSPLTVQIGW